MNIFKNMNFREGHPIELKQLCQFDNRSIRVLEAYEPKKSKHSLRPDRFRVKLNALSFEYINICVEIDRPNRYAWNTDMIHERIGRA